MKTKPPFHTQDNRRHETTTTLKSVKNWYFKYIVGLPTVIFWYQFHKAVSDRASWDENSIILMFDFMQI